MQGRRLLHYQLLARLGAGGMGAQTLASLNHPNVAHVYGVEDRALVMELVEGEDLHTIIEWILALK